MTPILRVFAILIAVVSVVAAHDAPSGWAYPAECCTGKDCEVLAPSRVQTLRDGYLLDDKWYVPAMKAPVRRPWLAPYINLGTSGDNAFHACWSPIESEREYGPRCFFAPVLTQ